MTVRTFENRTGAAVSVTYFVDPAHYAASHSQPCPHATATREVAADGARFTFSDAEDNGADLLAIMAASNFTEV